jgi:hypothetical protein|uniref:Uncharacterized protein n=1 Tax=viral metagenome TaxID=1070528 RepID=A0A6C0CCS8_9ZZZZ
MDEVIQQAPDYFSKEEIEVIFKKNEENVINTLIDLWNLDAPKTKSAAEIAAEAAAMEIDINKVSAAGGDKWASIRDICDTYDLEMQTQMNLLKNRKQ